MRIHSLSYRNYRAFSGEDTIELNGKNQLVYGENGSGKSSLSQAFTEVIATLGNFQNAGDDNFENRFVESAERGTAWLSFRTKDTAGVETVYRMDRATLPDYIIPEMTTAMNRSRRLSYQDIWSILYSRTQFQHEVEKPNIFEYLVRFLGTAEVANPVFPTIRELRKEQIELYIKRNKISAGETIEEGVETPETLEQQQIRFRARVETYLENVKSIVSSVEARANSFLQYFYPEVSFEIEFPIIENILTVSTENELDWRFDHAEVAHLKIFYHGLEMDMTDVFLNEARLNALGLCIFLAGVVELSPAPNPDDLHLLVLDDVLIGLDMGNRIPLLKVLTEAEVPYTVTNAAGETETHLSKAFEHYQLILTTYDRAWFQAAKRWLNLHAAAQWEYKEMYAHRHFDRTVTPARYLYDIPVIRESHDHLASALRFMNDRDFPDYPSAANYLRKANEQIIKDIIFNRELPLKQIKTDGEIESLMLNDCFGLVHDFFVRISYDVSIINDLKDIYLKILLNPFSHHDIGAEVYREELMSVVSLTLALEQQLIESKALCQIILVKGAVVKMDLTTNAGDVHCYQLKLENDLFLVLGNISNTYFSEVNIVVSGNTTLLKEATTKSKSINTRWASLSDAYSKAIVHLTTPPPPAVAKILSSTQPGNYLDVVRYRDDAGNWSLLRDLL